ncbi:uncharacterized protein si:dkey-52l18.4 isoform X1 [Pangasianodon hypophthalmus]|uniref:uncharacterized protein si:dkey-52l18.4 isoform X1 n=1 Tax=Pangasianodon hypophthalmus TaxID=310915 RepID=UPI000EFF67E9|nr:uncharacterized protein si:dkey-52l18.4 isoform X1 [Pangasianodon hypophthalmus]
MLKDTFMTHNAKNSSQWMLFTILAVSCHLQVCLSECVPAVLASRKSLYIPEGGSVSLWCDILHCEQKWTGGWGIRQGYFTFLTPSPRVHLSNKTITDNATRLFLEIHNLNQSDSGVYQCNINWEESNSQGHVTKINVTEGSFDHFMLEPTEPTGRKLSFRLLVCAAASLCFPLALALAYCLSSDRQPAPPIPPPRSRNSSTARVKPKADVVYATMSLNRPRQQNTTQARMPKTAVIYSTLNFSTA